MPEGPELLFFATYLKKKLLNAKITKILSFTDKPVKVPTDFIGKILDIDCKGKLLWMKVTGKTDEYYIHIHYGISGWFTFEKPEKNIKFEFVIEKNNKTKNLYLEDQRRFSKISINKLEKHDEIISKLGIDIFSKEFTVDIFKEIIKSKNTILAGFLLKQQIFCGIGNYIKNESIYMANLGPKIKTSELDDKKIDKLYEKILFVAYSNLFEMLGEYKLEKYLNINKKKYIPDKLQIPYKYRIYGREQTDDGTKIYKIKVSGRDSYTTDKNA